MEFSGNIPSCDEVNKLDIVDYLSKLGFEPEKKRINDYWYHSPLRNENTPSFKVNRNINKWYDHGTGNGGSLIDFGILFFKCSVSEFLRKFHDPLSFQQPHLKKHIIEKDDDGPKILVTNNLIISSIRLIEYIHSRCIDLSIAQRFCREVNFDLYDKKYFAIGFKNNSGGYELRNEFFKGSSKPKDITLIKNGANNISVFEGFFNFLSLLMITRGQDDAKTDFLILNSRAFFERARPLMEQYPKINLYLDRNKPGLQTTQYALTIDPKKYIDQSNLYQNYEDLNDMLVGFGKIEKNGQNSSKRR